MLCGTSATQPAFYTDCLPGQKVSFTSRDIHAMGGGCCSDICVAYGSPTTWTIWCMVTLAHKPPPQIWTIYCWDRLVYVAVLQCMSKHVHAINGSYSRTFVADGQSATWMIWGMDILANKQLREHKTSTAWTGYGVIMCGRVSRHVIDS